MLQILLILFILLMVGKLILSGLKLAFFIAVICIIGIFISPYIPAILNMLNTILGTSISL